MSVRVPVRDERSLCRGHCALGSGRAAEVLWPSNRRQFRIARRPPACQRLLPGKLICEGARLDQAASSLSSDFSVLPT